MRNAIVLTAMLAASSAPAGPCMDLVKAKEKAESRHARWIDLTPEQFQFLRGIFYGNTQTPDRLPFGSSAAIAKTEGEGTGAIFFIDGDRACDPLLIPNSKLEILNDIGAGVVLHEPVQAPKPGENP